MRAALELTLDLDRADSDEARRQQAAEQLGRSLAEIGEVRVRKRSIDARRGRVVVRLPVDVYSGEPAPPEEPPPPAYPPDLSRPAGPGPSRPPRPVIRPS